MPAERLGPYRLLRQIGEGGMGQVFAAIHEHLDQQVALKLLSPAAAEDPESVARILQEARALAQIQHPGVVRILHCDRLEDGKVFLAMEYLDGVSLRAWMRLHQGTAVLGASLGVGQQIADAMVEVHARGIVHRDLKPENVILCDDKTMPFGHRVKVVDFGIAKVPPSADGARLDTQVHTAAPMFLGTTTYMAPEQCRRASEVTAAADVYALGVLLFEVLAGKPPFVSEEPIEVITMHVREEPPPLQDFAKAIPGALAAFIASMLAKDPRQRPTMLRVRDMLGRPWEGERDECPIPGLSPFTEAQVALFFGRSAEINDLRELLEETRAGERRWVQIEGPSGSGKTSLVQAGLLPRLREDLAAEVPRWRIIHLRPSSDPLRGLAQAIIAAYGGNRFDAPAEDVERGLREDAGALSSLVTAHTPPGCCALLIVEQMEELFTLAAPDGHRLDALLSTALAAPSCPLRLLTTLRSDFVHRLDQMPDLARLLNKASRYHLRAMDAPALAQVIEGMAQRAGLRLAEGLPERMVRDAASEGSRLPLLGHALRGLWSLRSGTLLTHERYEQLGGVSGALARQAELLLDDLGEQGRERARWIILDLVQVGRGAPDTRRPRTRQEVLAAAGGDRQAEDVLMRLSGVRAAPSDETMQNLRLVVLSSEPDPRRQRVDLVHETLLGQVRSIAEWIDRERALLERRADLEVAVHAWEQAGCPAEGLPSGSLLEHYRGLTGSTPRRDGLMRIASERAARFLEAAQRLERRRSLFKRAFIGVLVAAAAAIALTAVRAVREQRRAETNLQHMVRATDQVVSDADWALGRLAHTLDVRRKMLRQIDENLASLPAQEREEPEVRKSIIKTKHRQSDLARLDETLARADALLVEALEEIQRGLSRGPSEDLAFLLALNHSKRGKVALARGRLTDAREHFAAALTTLERRRSSNDDEDFRRTLATSYSEQADLELELGHADVAAALHDRALALLEKNNESPYDRSLLALTLCSRGQAALQGGDQATAKDRLERALKIQGPLAETAAGNLFYESILTQIHVELAALAAVDGNPAVATEHHRTAQALGRALHRGEPTDKSYALVLGQSLAADEALARARGDMDHAEGVRRERCALVDAFLREDGEDVRFQRLACR